MHLYFKRAHGSAQLLRSPREAAEPTRIRGAARAGEARNSVNDSVALRAGIPPFHVMTSGWRRGAPAQPRRSGEPVGSQPSVGAPEPVRAAAAAALHANELGYTVALGIPELRAAIAADYQRRHGISVESDAVWSPRAPRAGSCWLSWRASTWAIEWRLASPGYPCYRNILSALGCEVVEIECGPETRFQPTARMLAELDPPVRGVIVASRPIPPGPSYHRPNWRRSRPGVRTPEFA